MVAWLSRRVFQQALSETDAAFGDRWKWTGRENNSYTGMQYNRARYYSGESGIWSSEDPLRLASGDYLLQRYSRNNTLNSFDASGLQSGSKHKQDPTQGIYVFIKGVPVDALLAASKGWIYQAAWDFGAGYLPKDRPPTDDEWNRSEAARHMLWQALIDIYWSESVAKDIGDGHEVGEVEKGRGADSGRDLGNNDRGRKLGKQLQADIDIDIQLSRDPNDKTNREKVIKLLKGMIADELAGGRYEKVEDYGNNGKKLPITGNR